MQIAGYSLIVSFGLTWKKSILLSIQRCFEIERFTSCNLLYMRSYPSHMHSLFPLFGCLFLVLLLFHSLFSLIVGFSYCLFFYYTSPMKRCRENFNETLVIYCYFFHLCSCSCKAFNRSGLSLLANHII